MKQRTSKSKSLRIIKWGAGGLLLLVAVYFVGMNIMMSQTIKVDGDMPQHGHGLPTSPRVTKYLGNGDYLIDGMKFQMGGWWLMDLTITADTQIDAVHFNMLLH